MPAVQCSTAGPALLNQTPHLYIAFIETRRLRNLRRMGRRPKSHRLNGRKTMLFWAFLLKRYRAWRVYRETYKALANLDTRSRADIGVTWLEIDGIARRAALKAAA